MFTSKRALYFVMELFRRRSDRDEKQTQRNTVSSCCFARITNFYFHELKEAELRIRENRIFVSDGKTG